MPEPPQLAPLDVKKQHHPLPKTKSSQSQEICLPTWLSLELFHSIHIWVFYLHSPLPSDLTHHHVMISSWLCSLLDPSIQDLTTDLMIQLQFQLCTKLCTRCSNMFIMDNQWKHRNPFTKHHLDIDQQALLTHFTPRFLHHCPHEHFPPEELNNVQPGHTAETPRFLSLRPFWLWTRDIPAFVFVAGRK